ncbi:MAG: glycosyltransferase [Sphingobacteriaceae bacterium]|nr:glycosyltransferase [Sphingobacteriaceae bacterium]
MAFDEISVTHKYFSSIYIVTNQYNANNLVVPENCYIKDVYTNSTLKLSFSELINCLRIVLSDFSYYPKKKVFLKSFRYNLSLIKQLHLKAKMIGQNKDWFTSNSVVYAYWADNLATTASILVQRYQQSAKCVARGHGFEIFEEQTPNKMIKFRGFQYQYLNKLFADSKNGLKHLDSRSQYQNFNSKNSLAYVGTADYGIGPFDTTEFNIVTCSVVRDVKRVHLLTEILKHISFSLTWHIMGDGPLLDELKKLNNELPKNIKVIYYGYMSNKNIFQFYKTTSVNLLVSLSSSEGLPVSMIEAQSFGIPILSTDVGGCNEICNEQTGFLVEKNFNPTDVAKKYLSLKIQIKTH